MSDLGPHLFKGLSSLKELDLRDNKLISINHDAFEELENLEELCLNRKQLTRIEANGFKILENLEYFDREDYLLFKKRKVTGKCRLL